MVKHLLLSTLAPIMKWGLIFFTFFTYFAGNAQSKKEILTNIVAKYQVIRELVDSNVLRQHHSTYACQESTETGTLTFYYNSNELKHILHSYTQGHVTYTDEYYIWDRQLFFQFATHQIWYKDHVRKYRKVYPIDVTLTLEERFYFHEETAVKCQFKDYETRSNRNKNPKTQYVRNKTIDCDLSQKVIEKFRLLLTYQEGNEHNACNLPRSIAKLLIDDVVISK